MNKVAGILTLSVSILAAGAGTAISAGPYTSVGTLSCAFVAGGPPDAIPCEFQANSGGEVEIYFGLVGTPFVTKTAAVRWDVLKSASAGNYQLGGLVGEYAGTGADGSLVGTSKDGILLQVEQSSRKGATIRFFALRTK